MTNQAKECEWNEAVEEAAKVADDLEFVECATTTQSGPYRRASNRDVATAIRSLKRAPSHQAGQEGIVGRLNAHIDASTKPDWRELAALSDLITSQATRIEMLKEALRFYADEKNWIFDYASTSPCDGDNGKIASAALADGGG